MQEDDFQSFGKILHIGKLYMSITQKIHGSNAQVYIWEEDGIKKIKAGCRTRWITPEDDNYGFAKFIEDHADEFIEKLGVGRHFGEWAGPGINSSEGLSEKTLVLFNWRRWNDKELPARTTVVPMLYKGSISLNTINELMQELKEQGSFLVPGYMKPEGVVIELDGQFYKNVFDLEEVKWTGEKKIREKKETVDVSHLLQPLRLEKLLSRDEKYLRYYPESLGSICSHYTRDLEYESQFSTNEDERKEQKKALGKQIYYFIKSVINS